MKVTWPILSYIKLPLKNPCIPSIPKCPQNGKGTNHQSIAPHPKKGNQIHIYQKGAILIDISILSQFKKLTNMLTFYISINL